MKLFFGLVVVGQDRQRNEAHNYLSFFMLLTSSSIKCGKVLKFSLYR